MVASSGKHTLKLVLEVDGAPRGATQRWLDGQTECGAKGSSSAAMCAQEQAKVQSCRQRSRCETDAARVAHRLAAPPDSTTEVARREYGACWAL